MTIEELYRIACETPSDINEHLPTLRRLASRCEEVVEFGTRDAVSTTAFAASGAYVRSFDINPASGYADKLQSKTVTFMQRDTLALMFKDPFDMLFIDTLHTSYQVFEELSQHADKVRKYLVFHDTETFGTVGEDGGPGLLDGINRWHAKHPEWSIVERYENNNGLIVMERIEPQKKLRIACICPSYRRPECLQTTLAQFQAQVTEHETHLFMLEDSGSWDSQNGDKWSMLCVPKRFATFGQKFNYLCRTAKNAGYDAVVILEDDDVYLPNHVDAHAKVLVNHRYSVPSRKVVDCHRKHPVGLLEWSDLREEINPLPTGLHGSWAFHLDLWEEVGGYPEEAMDGFDLEFGRRLMECAGPPGDYCEFTTPQYGYRWSSAPGKNCRNASAYSTAGQLYYDRAAEQGDATDQHGRKLTPFMDAGAMEFARLMCEHYETKPSKPAKLEEPIETDALFFWLDSMKKCITSGQYALFAVGRNPDGTFTQYPLKQDFPDDMRVWAIAEMRKAMCAA